MFYLGWFTVYHDIGVNHITVPSWYYQPELYRSGIQAPLGASRCAYDLNVTHQLAPIGAWIPDIDITSSMTWSLTSGGTWNAKIIDAPLLIT